MMHRPYCICENPSFVVGSPEEEHNVIIPKGTFPSIRNAKVLVINTVYGKNRFVMEGFKEVMKQATKICESYIPFIEEEVEAKEMDT